MSIKKKRRVAIRIDMTPMVDIAFLLLIFYMVTTVFSMPQAMEINLPPESKEILPVSTLDQRTVGDGKPGPVWEKMIELYRQYKHQLRNDCQ